MGNVPSDVGGLGGQDDNPMFQEAMAKAFERMMAEGGPEAAAKKMGINVAKAGQARTNQELRDEYQESLTRLWKGVLKIESAPLGSQILTDHGVKHSKPVDEFPTPPLLDTCLPIRVADLQLDTTHRGRVLRGTIVEEQPLVIKCAMVLLQDDYGDLVMVNIYDLIPLHYKQSKRWELAKKKLPKGTRLAIIEPFYKVMKDGTLGVRVDNPREVIFLKGDQETGGGLMADPAQLQQQGNELFKRQEYTEAVAIYTKALDALMMQPPTTTESTGAGSSNGTSASSTTTAGTAHLLVPLLLNCSACHLALNQPIPALACALTATTLQPTAGKAYYRAALAIDRLASHSAQSKAAVAYMQQAAVKLGGDKAELLGQLSDSTRRHRSVFNLAAVQTAVKLLTDAANDHVQSAVSPTPASSPATGAAALKDQGNEQFKVKKYQAALQCYTAGISSVTATCPQLFSLLSNRALCKLRTDEYLPALQDTLAAVVLGCQMPLKSKVLHRQATALLQLGWLTAAESSASLALAADPDNEELQAMQKQVEAAARAGAGSRASAAGGATSSAGPSPTFTDAEGESRTERTERFFQRENDLPPEALSNMNDMMSFLQKMHAGNKKLPKMVDDRVAPFHTEYGATGRWPAQCDISAAKKLLLNAYEHARSRPMMDRMINPPADKLPDPMDLLKRLGSNERHAIEWLVKAPLGGMRDAARDPYTRTVRHNFTNVPARQEVLTPGTTHVSVGFVDLSGLANAQLMPESATHKGPLRWVGYESSAYAVAKTLVIHHMLMDGAEVDAAVQVWYSSAWSSVTLAAFKKSLTSLINDLEAASSGGSGVRGQPPEVLALLKHWLTRNVSLKQSRQQWLSNIGNTLSWLGNFKRKADRLALCHYIVSGQLLDADVGSVVMFSVPDSRKYGEQALDENVLQTIPATDLFKRLGSAPKKDIMAVALDMVKERTATLRDRVLNKQATVEVRLAAVAPTSHAVISEIHDLKPWTMSWSNVPDYINTVEFHRMARRCSAEEDTIHFMHSMNWLRDVKGACHMDVLFHMGNKEGGKFLADMLDGQRTRHLPLLYKSMDWDPFLLCPPVDEARNIVDSALMAIYSEDWLRHWFHHAWLKRFDRQVHVVDPPCYYVTARSNSTFHFTWSYDPNIWFKPNPDTEIGMTHR